MHSEKLALIDKLRQHLKIIFLMQPSQPALIRHCPAMVKLAQLTKPRKLLPRSTTIIPIALKKIRIIRLVKREQRLRELIARRHNQINQALIVHFQQHLTPIRH